jgi:hypothetical protein
MFKDPRFRKKIKIALLFFLYATLGYWIIRFAFDPQKFWGNFKTELWVIPVSLGLATIQFFRTKL